LHIGNIHKDVLRVREARRLIYPAPEGEDMRNAVALKWYRKASAQGLKLADDMIRKLET